ncbi:MAG: butyrate kinase [Treponema sp.]|jgi:butyrate kinase|nr:butyrate kinase [Treponema sp.]
MERILILNLGSTSTKLAVYEGAAGVLAKTIKYGAETLAPFKEPWDQVDLRKNDVLSCLKEGGIKLEDLNLIACRGGNFHPVPGGIYMVNEDIIADMRTGKWGVHPTGVGGLISFQISRELGIPAITMDPPITDEFEDIARYSGIKEIQRISSFHALSVKSTARKIAREQLHKPVEELNLILVHMGGGISVCVQKNGRVIDGNNSLDGDGPFSPERAGSLPTGDLVHLCFSGKYTENEVLKKLRGAGGWISYLGTNDGLEVERRIEAGDKEAKNVYDAMIYQICKEIGAMAAVLSGEVDAIALTGSLAYADYIVEQIKKRTAFIAPLISDPGENEMRALHEGALRFLRGEEAPKPYVREAP